MICEDMIKVLQKHSPEAYACDWDNVGLLAGNRQKEVKTVYIALDATDAAIEDAIRMGADMLLTHHPMIFKGIKKINTDDFIGRRIIKLIQNEIAYYAMHTNFDIIGMADLAAGKINLKDTKVLHETHSLYAGGMLQETGRAETGVAGFGKVGNLPEKMTLLACAESVKETFGLETVKVFGELGHEVERAAICPGSGKRMVGDSLREGAQVLITGDIDYHDGIDAVARNLYVIDAGHYGLEQIFVPYMQQFLEQNIPGIHIVAQPPKQPFTFV